jgi:EAL domain-containing protein (putative c-di-GMP-specific phosphodiesterase class I)
VQPDDFDSAPTSADRPALHQTMSETVLPMVYQPIVELTRRRIFAYEALVRAKAYRSPVDLIADAAAAGCIGQLGRLLRSSALVGCQNAPLFLNVHPEELTEPYLVQPDDPIFTHSEDIFIELTEAVPLQRIDLCLHMLAEIRDRGVQVVVDDLGSGYSNLRYLADLKPRVVKLDRELVTGLEKGSRRFTLIKGLVRMCEDLSAKVVAEGIETPGELDAVIEAGCHLGQGYVLARPAMPPPDFVWPL